MNRTLTAAVALAAGLGMAGLAQAQMSTSPTNSANPATPSSPTPSVTTQSPNAQNPSAGTYGTQGPQASSQTNRGGQQNVSQSEIQQAQQQLRSQGLYNGAIDGLVGPETQTALSQFQRQQGLPETAQLDQQTLDRLMSGNSSTSSGSTQTQGMRPTGAMNPATGPQPTTNPTTNR
jgi:peptidoglycan hydrolase-like protein with peptidoglycan-binding domain